MSPDNTENTLAVEAAPPGNPGELPPQSRPVQSSARFAVAVPARPDAGWWRWGLGAVLGVAAVGVRAALEPWLQGGVPFVFAFPALVMAALLAGAGPGLLALAVSTLLVMLPLVREYIGAPMEGLHLIAYLMTGLTVVIVCARARPGVPGPSTAGGAESDEEARSLVTQGRRTQHWLRLLMLLALLLPTAFFLNTAWQTRERSLEDARARVNRMAVIAREHGLKLVHMNGLLLEQMQVRFDGLSASDFDAQRPQVQSTLAGMVRSLPDVRALMVWDSQGRLLAQAGVVDPVLALQPRSQDFFSVHQQPDAGMFTSVPLESSERPGEWQIVVTDRRNGADGAFAGVYAVVIDLASFVQFYRDLLRTERSGAVALFRPDGAIIVRQPDPPRQGMLLPPDHPMMQQVHAGRSEGQMTAVSTVDQTERLIAFQRLNGHPLYVGASVQQEEIFASWYREVALLAAFTFPLALALAGVSWVALRQVRREQRAVQRWHDETVKRAQAEDALRQTQRLEALGHLTGGVAHDVNNLLMVVSNNAYLLRRLISGGGRAPTAAALQKADKPIDAILRAVTTGSRLTRQLLAFARRQALRPTAVRLQDRLPLLLDLMRHSISAVIQLDGDVDPDTSPILVDPSELELAMINLAVNARDAMPEGGRLHVEVRNAAPSEHRGLGTWVSITVADTGVGMPPEVLQRVFEPFFTTKEQGKATGLGLSQVYGFCQQAGGTARIESAPGAGTRVQLLLPGTAELPDPTAPGDLPAAEAEGRLLLVEDNAEVADATEPMLTSWGYQVHSERSGDAARLVLQQQPDRFDLLLTDIVMPGATDGLSLARHVRQHHPDIGIVMMTGHARETDKAMAEGFVVLQKPWTPSALSQALERAHPKRRQGR